MNASNNRRKRQEETGSPVWDQLRKLDKECGHIMEEEIMCDLLRGPEDEECQKLFLQNEDCYQRVLCHER